MRSDSNYSDIISESEVAPHPDMAKVLINKRNPKRHAIDIRIEDISVQPGTVVFRNPIPEFSKEKSWKKELLK